MLIILGVIIVGIAVAVGISMFTSQSDEAIKDHVANDLNVIGVNAYQYRIKALMLGGGNGSFVNYQIPGRLTTNSNIGGAYALDGPATNGLVKLKVTAPAIATGISATVDSTGKIIVTGR